MDGTVSGRASTISLLQVDTDAFMVSFLPVFLFVADSDSLRDTPPVETRTAPVQSVVMMECRTDLRQPVKYTWSRQGGILPKSARVEGVSHFFSFTSKFSF